MYQCEYTIYLSICIARNHSLDGTIIVADRDVQELYFFVANATLIVVFQEFIEVYI